MHFYIIRKIETGDVTEGLAMWFSPKLDFLEGFRYINESLSKKEEVEQHFYFCAKKLFSAEASLV